MGIGAWIDGPVPARGRCHRLGCRPVMPITISGRFRTIQDCPKDPAGAAGASWACG